MKTLQELVSALNYATKEQGIDNALDLLSIFTQYQGKDWKQFYPADPDDFQCTTIHKNEYLKLLVIYWNSKRISAKHGHMQGGGLMRVLTGELTETRFDPDDQEKAVGTFNYTPGDLSFIHDALAFHVVKNTTTQAAVSLHLYCAGENSDFGKI